MLHRHTIETTKAEFYPQIEKKNLYPLGYVAFEKSTHFTLKNEPFPKTYFDFVVK